MWRWVRPLNRKADTGEGVILIKDAVSGEVIGFERLYFRPLPDSPSHTVELDQGGGLPHG